MALSELEGQRPRLAPCILIKLSSILGSPGLGVRLLSSTALR